MERKVRGKCCSCFVFRNVPSVCGSEHCWSQSQWKETEEFHQVEKQQLVSVIQRNIFLVSWKEKVWVREVFNVGTRAVFTGDVNCVGCALLSSLISREKFPPPSIAFRFELKPMSSWSLPSSCALRSQPFFFEFSLAPNISLWSDWPVCFLWDWFHATQSKSPLCA